MIDNTLYYRYVDDIILLLPSHQTSIVLELFKNFHTRLILEMMHNCIHFLDVSIYISDNKFNINYYQKPTWLGIYLNYYSYLAIKYKKNCSSGPYRSCYFNFWSPISPSQHKHTNKIILTLNNNSYHIVFIKKNTWLQN